MSRYSLGDDNPGAEESGERKDDDPEEGNHHDQERFYNNSFHLTLSSYLIFTKPHVNQTILSTCR
jgi:hypothetical protein